MANQQRPTLDNMANQSATPSTELLHQHISVRQSVNQSLSLSIIIAANTPPPTLFAFAFSAGLLGPVFFLPAVPQAEAPGVTQVVVLPDEAAGLEPPPPDVFLDPPPAGFVATRDAATRAAKSSSDSNHPRLDS